MPLLYTDSTWKTIFLQGRVNSLFKRNKSLKELLAPSLYPNNKVNRVNLITSCIKCDICKNYLICSNYFTCSRRVLHCNCNNLVYLITSKNCLKQYLDSATNFKSCFKVHKSHIKTNKCRCGTAKHFNVSVKMLTIFVSSCLFKLLNNFIVMPQTLKKLHGTEKNISKVSY